MKEGMNADTANTLVIPGVTIDCLIKVGDGTVNLHVLDHVLLGALATDVGATAMKEMRKDPAYAAAPSGGATEERFECENPGVEPLTGTLDGRDRSLERLVAQLSADLAAANKELDSFTYAISHDLRAPLRHIEGFSRMLLEDCSANLDSEGKRYVERIRVGTLRLGQMIESLVTLSRITRREMAWGEVDLSGLAQAIADCLRQSAPDRKVDLVIAAGLVARGDERMLRTALENLIGNAWKFTSKQSQARIELGARNGDGEVEYFVRDDGAGFDMAYAGKLFGAFQRLHTEAEFEGTGIGLAIVQRILRRHGGRIRAESVTGQGATFYFTLGSVPPVK
ncbi:MAG: hypothetical protein HY270_12315 [Deltaproteobacteria bacterium]|nr:hypothetical protein [Deltaproteobacteria bacterium]